MEEVKGDNDSRKRAEEELEKLKSQIAAKEAELENIKPQVNIYHKHHKAMHKVLKIYIILIFLV